MFWSLLRLMVPCQHLCTGSPLIQINIYNGTATIQYQPSTVSSVLYSIGQKKCVLQNNNWKKNKIISNKPLHCADTQDGPWTELKRRPGFLHSKKIMARDWKTTTPSPNIRRTHITVPYNRGLSESYKNTCKKYGIQVYLRGGKTIKNLLVAPKDREHITQKSGIIYRYRCNRVEGDEEYIGESARTFGERYKEHLKCPSPIYDHSNITGHNTTLDNFSIVGREDQNLMRLIKEAIYIRVNNPSLNKNIGKYHLPHIWDEVLNNITELKLK